MAPTNRPNRRRPKTGLGKQLIPGTNRPSNPSQVITSVWLQGPTLLNATQASTALFNTSYVAPSLSALTNAASWKALFDEWRLLEIRFRVQPCTLANGITKFIVDDEDLTTENKSWNDSRRGIVLSNNSGNPKSTRVITYRSMDFDDLAWQSSYSSATYTPCALKMYTDATNYGSPTSTNLWLISWEGHFQFRGIGANQ